MILQSGTTYRCRRAMLHGPWIEIGELGKRSLAIVPATGDEKRDVEIGRMLAAAPELLDRLASLETAARRFADGKDSSPTYVLKMCEKAREVMTQATGN